MKQSLLQFLSIPNTDAIARNTSLNGGKSSAIPGSLIVGLTAAGLDGRLGPTVPGTHG